MGFRLSNVIGAPFKDFVSQQLTTRADRSGGNVLSSGNYNRSPDEVLYLANKTSWVSLKSSVNVSRDYARELQQYYTEEDGFNASSAVNQTLAANWILQAGTSKARLDAKAIGQALVTGVPQSDLYTTENILRDGIGLDGAYGLGGIVDQGYRPMPGLESVNIETAGKLGSLRYATINFKVWNMNQLDVIDALYFRLGFTMLLEWGHTMYFLNNKQTLERATGGIDGFFSDLVVKEEVQYRINERVKETNGNYDGMLGVVTNFNYSLNQDGGWDCSIKLVGLGSIIETQKINSQYRLPDGANRIYKRAIKNLEANLRARAQADADAAASEARLEEERRYNNEVAAFDRANPIKDLQTLYQVLTGTSYPLDLNNSANVDELWKASIVTPFSPDNTGVDQQFINDVANYPLRAPGYVVKVGNNQRYFPAFVKKGLQSPNTGFRYWLQASQGWKLNASRVDDFVAFIGGSRGIPVQGYRDASGGAAIPVQPPSTANSFADLVRTVYAKGNLVLPYDKTINKAGLDIKIEGKYRLLEPGTIIDTYKSTNIQVKYGASQTRIVDINEFGNYWYLDVSVKSVNTNIGLARADQLSAEVNNKLIVALNNSVWTVQAIGVDTYDLLNSDPPYQAKIKLQTNIKVEGITHTTDSGEVGNGIADLVVTIDTNIISILDELVNAGAGFTTITPIDPAKGAVQTIPPSTSEKVTNAPFNSALEAMLTVVQYKGIEERDPNKVVPVSIEAITRSLLGSLPNAPLADIFKANDLKKPTTSLQTEEEIFKDPYSLGIKGYNSSLLSRQTDIGITALTHYNAVPTVNFKELFNSYVVPLSYTDSSISSESTLAAIMETPVYIPLGYLLFFINNMCLLYDDTKKPSNNSAARPHFYIDFNPKTNLCLTIPSHLSIDPTICLIPRSGQQDDYLGIFKSMGVNNPAKAMGSELFNTAANDAVSGKLPSFKDQTQSAGYYQGYTMNILLNTQYLLDIIRDTAEKDNHNNVYFRPFMDRLLADINKCLGDVNAFRLGYMDESNTAAIFDDQFVPGLDKETNALRMTTPTGKFILPIYGLSSMARNFNYETNISTRMSSMIAIGARGTENSGSTQSSDASALMKLSEGLQDRVIKKAEDMVRLAGIQKVTTKPDDNTEKLAKQFNSHVKSIYSLGEVDKLQIAAAKNYLIQALTYKKAIDPGTSGAPVIPLNLNVTVDGISGINMGNVFLIPDEMTPKSLRASREGGYFTPRFGYMVVGLTHDIQNNMWTTAIRGQLIKLRGDDSYKQASGKPTVGTSLAPRGGGTGAVAATTITGASNELRVLWDKLSPLGYSRAAVAGIGGTLYAESGLQYGAWIIGATTQGGITTTNAGSAKGQQLDAQSGATPSTFVRPTYQGNRITAYGIAQWTQQRLDNYILYVNGSGTMDSYATQVDFLISEINTRPTLISKLKAVADNENGAGEAALVWLDYFEFSTPSITIQSERDKRVANGKGAWEIVKRF